MLTPCYEGLQDRQADVCCVEESNNCGSRCHIIKDKYSRYKLYWSRNSKSTACVGVLVAEKWIVKVLEVE